MLTRLQRRAGMTETPHNTSRGTSSRDILAQAESRLRAKMIADSLIRDQNITAWKEGRISTAELGNPPEELSPMEMLSTEELRHLDDVRARERFLEDQQRKTLYSLGVFVSSHPEFPSDTASMDRLTSYCTDHGLNPGNVDIVEQAYRDLVAAGEIVQNFTAANRIRNEANVDQLRAVGYDIKPVPLEPGPGLANLTAWREKVVEHMNAQPKPVLADAFLTDTTTPQEPEFVAPYVPTIEDYS